MLFYRGELIDVSKGKGKPEGDIAGDVYRQIEELRSKYFDKDKKGVISLRYPNGRLKKHEASRMNNRAAVYEPKKIFFVSLKSNDGQWQWSDQLASVNGINSHNYNKRKISDPTLFYEKDLAELFPEIFPVENNYNDSFLAADFKKCSGKVEMLPCGSLLWVPGGNENRFDNVRVFIAGKNSKRWKKI